MKKPIFYSFHFVKDVHRVQQVRNMGMIDGNEPASPNEWETLRRQGDRAIEKWIADTMHYKQCVVVLVGEETASRRWVQYEIAKAWEDNRGLVGIRIHNLKCMRTGVGTAGPNPFMLVKTREGMPVSNYVTLHDPSPGNAYTEISQNLAQWVDAAIASKRR